MQVCNADAAEGGRQEERCRRAGHTKGQRRGHGCCNLGLALWLDSTVWLGVDRVVCCWHLGCRGGSCRHSAFTYIQGRFRGEQRRNGQGDVGTVIISWVLGCVYQTSLGDKALILWLAEKPCKYCLTKKTITISTITIYIYDIYRESVYIYASVAVCTQHH